MTSPVMQIIISDNAKPEHRSVILDYIKSLEDRKLPVILSGEHLSQLLELQESALYAISNSQTVSVVFFLYERKMAAGVKFRRHFPYS